MVFIKDLQAELEGSQDNVLEEESLRCNSIAQWLGYAIKERSLEAADLSGLTTLPKNDVAFSDLQLWKALLFFHLANTIHYSVGEAPEEERDRLRRKRDGNDATSRTGNRSIATIAIGFKPPDCRWPSSKMPQSMYFGDFLFPPNCDGVRRRIC